MTNPTGKGGFREHKDHIWKKGRPKSFDAARELAQAIAHETAQKSGEPLVIAGHIVTITEAILRSWAQSKDPRLQMAFVEYAYGKVPQNVDLKSDGKIELVVRYAEPDDNSS